MADAAGRDWDAATYDRVAAPQEEWGREVLGRLELRGDETVLDAGCGSGRVTRLLVERLPRGRVIGVDVAPSMVGLARQALGARARVLEADLLELTLDEAVDVVFSSAVFHWIPDHDRLFARLHAALVPGGRLVAQCGGAGNLERFLAVVDGVAARPRYARWLEGWKGPWRFAGSDETAARLRGAGFAQVSCWLEERLVAPTEPGEFARAVCLRHHLERLPGGLRERFVEEVLAAAGEPLTLDYVRLNVEARRPA